MTTPERLFARIVVLFLGGPKTIPGEVCRMPTALAGLCRCFASACEGLRKPEACKSTQRLRNNGNACRGRSACERKARRSEKEDSGTRRQSARLPKTYPPGELSGGESAGLNEGPDGLPKGKVLGNHHHRHFLSIGGSHRNRSSCTICAPSMGLPSWQKPISLTGPVIR